MFLLFSLALSAAAPGDFERPPEGCLDMDDPRIQDENDPRRKKYKIEICCLAPEDPRAANPDDPRRKKYRDYAVRVCGPDVRALTIESLRRHHLDTERTELDFELLARDGSKQSSKANAVRARDRRSVEKLAYRFDGPGPLEGLTVLSITRPRGVFEQYLYLPAFGAVRRPSSADLKERLADTDYLLADLLAHDPDTFDYYFRRREGSGAEEAYVYSALPREELGADFPYHGYSIWLRARDLFVMKVQMFDRAKRAWKAISFEEPVEAAPGVLRANLIIVEDLQRRHRTTVRVLHREVNTKIDTAALDPARLGR